MALISHGLPLKRRCNFEFHGPDGPRLRQGPAGERMLRAEALAGVKRTSGSVAGLSWTAQNTPRPRPDGRRRPSPAN